MTDFSFIDVLVVGAGPVGLTLALDLARRGITCRIIDKQPTFPVGTRARGIGARTQEIFEDLGVLEALSAYVEPFLPSLIYDGNNKVVREINPPSSVDSATPPTPDVPYRQSLMVSQQYTDAVLRERLASFGGFVELNCRLDRFAQHPDHVVVEVVREGLSELIQVRYLVGCDGGASTVRKCAGLSFQGETWDDETYYLLGNISVSGLSSEYWHTWTDPTWGYVSLQPMIHGHTWLFAATVAPDEYGTLPIPTLETFQHLFDERIEMSKVHFSMLTWQSLYRRNIRIVDCYRSNRVLLAGDAAHVGQEQGMNIGIQDAYNLGWKLASVLLGAPDVLLETYQTERLPIVQQNLIAMSARRQTGLGGASAAAQSITNAILNKDTAVDPTQLSVTYWESRLSRNLNNAPGICAGDRAPDASCLHTESGEQVRLFDVFRGTHFTLLAFSDRPIPQLSDLFHSSLRAYTVTRPDNTTIPHKHTLVDSDGHAYHAYGVSNAALVLVRPDGYIGFTGESLSPEPIIDYLRDAIG